MFVSWMNCASWSRMVLEVVSFVRRTSSCCAPAVASRPRLLPLPLWQPPAQQSCQPKATYTRMGGSREARHQHELCGSKKKEVTKFSHGVQKKERQPLGASWLAALGSTVDQSCSCTTRNQWFYYLAVLHPLLFTGHSPFSILSCLPHLLWVGLPFDSLHPPFESRRRRLWLKLCRGCLSVVGGGGGDESAVPL